MMTARSLARLTRRHLALIALLVAAFFCLLVTATNIHAQQPSGCPDAASNRCFAALEIGNSGLDLHYYFSEPGPAPTDLLIVMHGHSRDANRTFDAAVHAAMMSSKIDSTLIVAPLFGVAASQARRCSTEGVPGVSTGDLLWTCQSWMEGAAAQNAAAVSSFLAVDELIAALCRQYPSIRSVTFAGFSAGAQMVQHYIAFRGPLPATVTIRFVVSDPGTWLYFDPVRPVLGAASACDDSSDCVPVFAVPEAAFGCGNYNQWKYGVLGLPGGIANHAAQLRDRYANSDISYLEGSDDFGDGPKKAYRVLDRSCGANLQGPYRLQRGLAYFAYDRDVLAPSRPHSMVVVPGCAHDVSCVFPSTEGRAALFR